MNNETLGNGGACILSRAREPWSSKHVITEAHRAGKNSRYFIPVCPQARHLMGKHSQNKIK